MTGLMDCPHCRTRVLPLAGRICPACRRNVDEPDPGPTPEQVVGAAYGFAAGQMRDGVAPAEIREGLAQRGLGAEAAAAVVGDLERAKVKVERREGRRNLILGALLIVVGLGATAYSYQSAAAAGGGKYVFFWGAVVCGVIQFLRGLSQATA